MHHGTHRGLLRASMMGPIAVRSGRIVVPKKAFAICLVWAVVVIVFASQWFAYDASRAAAAPFSYYLWWSGYIWTLLTPVAVWLAWRFPITARNWRTRLPLHLAASVALTCVQLSLEAYLGWLTHRASLSAGGALRHYFSQHSQVSLVTYWLLVAAVTYYRQREQARETSLRSATLRAELTTARLEVLRRQLHPHFLFNTLQAAITLVHDDPDRAEEVLLRLSDLLRVSLQESQDPEIPLDRELAILDHYMGIQACRFQDRLQFTVCVDDDLRQCLVPSLVLQPLVENAVRHGIGTHKGSDTITIHASRAGTTLRLEVSNRASTLVSASDTPRGRGVGLAATRERLAHLYGTAHSSLELRSLDPTGVCAEVVIPFRMGA
jgi:two-component system, LytTR family, sensor kinase